MSWLGAIASNVEGLLDKVDQVAGHALSKEDGGVEVDPKAPAVLSTTSATTYSPFLSSSRASPSASTEKPENRTKKPTPISARGSVPRNIDTLTKSAPSDVTSSPSKTSNTEAVSKDPAEQELFEFLNNSSSISDAKADTRPASSASTRSGKTPDIQLPDGPPDDGNALHDAVDAAGTNGFSSGYHSSAEENTSGAAFQHHLSSVEVENQLLKSEITSLNQEMQSVIHRIQTTQEELGRAQRKLETQSKQLMASDQIARELRSRESDMQEVLATKETQLAVLRMRLDEADRKLELEKQRITDLQGERERILEDHSSSAGFHSQALDTLQEKLNDVESALRHETELRRKAAEEATEKQSALESEKQKLTAEVGQMHRSLDKEKAHSIELASQLKAARSQADGAKQELTDYKEKAARILQSKEKLIASLKEGTSGGKPGAGGMESTALLSELESVKQERDILHDELRASQHVIENLRTELAEIEGQLQQDAEVSREHIGSLEDQLQSERHRREDAEMEVSKQKQELRYVHEELLKQKTGFQQRVQDRDNEISRLRSQLTTKTVNASSQEELENRLHSLTESLIQKQTMLEALSTEKSSLQLQLEKTEKKYREAEASAVRASSAAVHMMDNDEVRQRLPSFMNESPFDSRVTRRVKMAANVIDRFSVRLGVFLRRYPIARVFVILYMGLLHLWVMIVLLTYQPEMHHGDFNVPHEPQ